MAEEREDRNRLGDLKSEAVALEASRRGSEEYLIVLRSVTEYAQIALRAVLLANGAGATAIIGFLGAAAGGKSVPANSYALASSSFLFALGVVFGVLASFLAYLSQFETLNCARNNGFVMTFNVSKHRTSGIILSFISLALFMLGVMLAIYGYVGRYCNCPAS